MRVATAFLHAPELWNGRFNTLAANSFRYTHESVLYHVPSHMQIHPLTGL
jgi:hypothetical protein